MELMSFAREIEINTEFSYEVFFLEVSEFLFCVRNKINDATLIKSSVTSAIFLEKYFLFYVYVKNNLMWHREEVEKVIEYTIEIYGTATR